jgi:hypothetical protein
MIIDLYQQSKLGEASAAAEQALSKVRSNQDEIARINARIEKLALTCQALYEILRDKTDVKDADVVAKMDEIDARDGKANGKMNQQVLDCPGCGQKTNSRRSTCVICGERLITPHIFSV